MSVQEVNSTVSNAYPKNVYGKKQEENVPFLDYVYEKRAAQGKNTNYKEYLTKNYRITPDKTAGCFDIYDRQGNRLGAFDYADVKIRQDAKTGKQFLISEHGTLSYDAIVLDEELKNALSDVMGKEKLETETLQGYQVKVHAGTGISVLVKDGEAGRGGKVLLQTEADRQKYEALAKEYFNSYPHLVKDMTSAYIRADLEIKGLMERTENGIISLGYDGVSYHDDRNAERNWNLPFSGNTYEKVYDRLRQGGYKKDELEELALWMEYLKNITLSQIGIR